MRTKVFLFTALVMNCLTGFSQKYLWNSQFGIADTETSAKSMAIDTDNNAYLTGNFTGAEMTIGNKEVTGASMVMDAYVAKFTPNYLPHQSKALPVRSLYKVLLQMHRAIHLWQVTSNRTRRSPKH